MKAYDIPRHWKEKIAADPDSEKSKKYLGVRKTVHKLNSEISFRTENLQSEVGSILMEIFERVGGVPCSDCKRTLLSLNRLTVSQIRERHNAFVIEIEKNAKKAKKALWARLSMYADQLATGGVVTRRVISDWIEEACEREEARIEQKINEAAAQPDLQEGIG